MIKSFKILQADVLVKHNIGTADQRKEMIDYAVNMKNQFDNKNLKFSNDGCWRNDFQYENIDWLISHIREMTNELIGHYIEQDPIYKNAVNEYGTPQVNYWTNINDIGSRNAIHDHRLHHYVACYYLQGTNTGEIIFHNPMNVTESCHAHAPWCSKYSYAPMDGDLLVWPAWVPHETDSNFSDRKRINVAFNIRFETPRYLQ